MIIGNIHDDNSLINYLPKAVKDSLKYLRETNLSDFEAKKYVVDGEKRFMIIDEYETIPISERKAEVHKKYTDIHFIISGKEKIGFGFRNASNKILEDKIEKDDYALYENVKDENEISLYTGDYVIFFPGEIHRPGCDVDGKCKVKKAIFKISLNKI